MAIQSHTALFHRRILYDKMRKRRAEVHEGWRHWRLQCHCCGGRPALLWILQNTSKTIPLGLGGGLVSIGKNCSAETTAKPRKHQKTTSLGLGGGLVSTGETKGKRELIKSSTPPTTWLRKTDLKMCNQLWPNCSSSWLRPQGVRALAPPGKSSFHKRLLVKSTPSCHLICTLP